MMTHTWQIEMRQAVTLQTSRFRVSSTGGEGYQPIVDDPVKSSPGASGSRQVFVISMGY